MTLRSDSGSSFSPIAVEPVTSQNKIVTVWRVAAGAAATVSAKPHERQKRARSGFSSPQFGQTTMRDSVRERASCEALALSSPHSDQLAPLVHREPAHRLRSHVPA